jgi:hypothetical protein
MTTAHDVQMEKHKLGTLSNHLAINAPRLRPTLQPVAFELVDSPGWSLVLSTVDTVEARWSIQRRLPADLIYPGCCGSRSGVGAYASRAWWSLS